MSETGRLFVVAGPSGAGKDTLISKVMKAGGVHLSVSATTRKAREGEEDGRDYRFLTDEEFDRLVEQGAFLEWKEVYGNRYGTLREEVDEAIASGKDVILEIDVKGALDVKAKAPEARLIFVMPPTMDELETRLRGRKADTEEEIEVRMETAPWEIEKGRNEFDHLIVNDDVERAARELARVMGR
jgi:guanylate kinase